MTIKTLDLPKTIYNNISTLRIIITDEMVHRRKSIRYSYLHNMQSKKDMASDSPRNHKVAHNHQQYLYTKTALSCTLLLRRRCLAEPLLAIQTWFCEIGITILSF